MLSSNVFSPHFKCVRFLQDKLLKRSVVHRTSRIDPEIKYNIVYHSTHYNRLFKTVKFVVSCMISNRAICDTGTFGRIILLKADVKRFLI